MTRIQLRIYTNPPQVEVFLNLKQPNGEDYRVAVVVDTGAQITLLPVRLMNFVEYRTVDEGLITVEQAGIARQSFSATESVVRLFLEDTTE
jgi:predicted aspartyl protease